MYFSESTLSEPEPLRKSDNLLNPNKNNTIVVKDEDVILKDTGKRPIIEVLSSTDNDYDVDYSEEEKDEDFLSPDTDSDSESDHLVEEKLKADTNPGESIDRDMPEIKQAIETLSSGNADSELINDLSSFGLIQFDSDHSNESSDLDNTLTEADIHNALSVKVASDNPSGEKTIDEESIIKKIEALKYDSPVNAPAIILDAEIKRNFSKSLLYPGNADQNTSECKNKSLSIIEETSEVSIPDSCKDTSTEDSFCCYPPQSSSETTQRINRRSDNTFFYSKSKTQEMVKFENSVPDELRIVNIDIIPGSLYIRRTKNIEYLFISCPPSLVHL